MEVGGCADSSGPSPPVSVGVQGLGGSTAVAAGGSQQLQRDMQQLDAEIKALGGQLGMEWAPASGGLRGTATQGYSGMGVAVSS